jgi:exosortase/archaeosortase family protein
LWAWLQTRLPNERADLRRLLLLPLLAFPWLTLDLAPLGWWFRLSGAWAADQLFGALGFVVTRQGTNLLVHGLPIEVAPACSGMNSLQAILIAGIILAWLELRGSRWFWLGVATLPVLAWFANAARICAVVGVALSWGAGFARGWFHEVGGWLVVMMVFGGWWLVLGFGGQKFAARRTLA